MATKYNEAFKAGALARLWAQDYPQKAAALAQVAADLGVAPRTLRRWFQAAGGADTSAAASPDDEPLPATIADKLEALAHKLLDRALQDEAVNGLNAQQAMSGAANAVEKWRALRDAPKELDKLLPSIIRMVEALTQLHKDPAQELDTLADLLERKAHDEALQ